MSVAVADACAIIAYCQAHHAHHEAAVSAIDAFDTVLVHPLNLAEVLAGLADDSTRRALQRALGETFTLYPNHSDEPDLAEHVFALAKTRADHRVRMSDAGALFAALRAEAALITFDAGLRRAAEAAGVRLAKNRNEEITLHDH